MHTPGTRQPAGPKLVSKPRLVLSSPKGGQKTQMPHTACNAVRRRRRQDSCSLDVCTRQNGNLHEQYIVYNACTARRAAGPVCECCMQASLAAAGIVQQWAAPAVQRQHHALFLAYSPSARQLKKAVVRSVSTRPGFQVPCKSLQDSGAPKTLQPCHVQMPVPCTLKVCIHHLAPPQNHPGCTQVKHQHSRTAFQQAGVMPVWSSAV